MSVTSRPCLRAWLRTPTLRPLQRKRLPRSERTGGFGGGFPESPVKRQETSRSQRRGMGVSMLMRRGGERLARPSTWHVGLRVPEIAGDERAACLGVGIRATSAARARQPNNTPTGRRHAGNRQPALWAAWTPLGRNTVLTAHQSSNRIARRFGRDLIVEYEGSSSHPARQGRLR